MYDGVALSTSFDRTRPERRGRKQDPECMPVGGCSTPSQTAFRMGSAAFRAVAVTGI